MAFLDFEVVEQNKMLQMPRPKHSIKGLRTGFHSAKVDQPSIDHCLTGKLMNYLRHRPMIPSDQTKEY